VVSALEDITGASERLADNPALARSLKLRVPYITPLSYLQIELIRRWRSGRTDDDIRQGFSCRSTASRLVCAIRDERERKRHERPFRFLARFRHWRAADRRRDLHSRAAVVQNFLAAASAAGDGALATAARSA